MSLLLRRCQCNVSFMCRGNECETEDGINLTIARMVVDLSVQSIRGRRIVVSVGSAIYARLLFGGSALFQSVADVARSFVIGVTIKRDACV